MKQLSIFFLLSFLLLSCNTKMIVLDKYKKNKIKGGALVITLLKGKTLIDIIEMKGENVTRISDQKALVFFKEGLSESISGLFKFDTVCWGKYSNNPYFDKVKLDLKNETITLSVPKESSQFIFQDIKSDYVLFIKDLTLNTKKIPLINEQGFQFGERKNIYLESYYVLWDNINATLIGYGFVNHEEGVSYEEGLPKLQSILDRYAYTMLHKVSEIN